MGDRAWEAARHGEAGPGRTREHQAGAAATCVDQEHTPAEGCCALALSVVELARDSLSRAGAACHGAREVQFGIHGARAQRQNCVTAVAVGEHGGGDCNCCCGDWLLLFLLARQR